jgi:hypothetical protein
MLCEVRVLVYGSNARATTACCWLLVEGQSVDQTNADRLLSETLIVITVGLGKFAKGLEGQGVDMIQVEWVLPAGRDREMIDLLDQL